MAVMVNAWTAGLFAGAAAIAAVLTFVLIRVFKRGRRESALGSLLIPVTALWLWACGITAEHFQTIVRGPLSMMMIGLQKGVNGADRPVLWSNGKFTYAPLPVAKGIAQHIVSIGAAAPRIVQVPGQNPQAATVIDPKTGAAAFPFVPSGGPMSVVATVSSSPVVAFWVGVAILGVLAVLAAVVTRRAGYVAAGGLVAFGVYQLIALAVFSSTAGNGAWYDWLAGMTSTATVCELAVGSVIAGIVLGRYTFVHDMVQRMTLTSRVEQLTQTRAEAVDAAAAELRRLERDLHDGAQARLVAIGLSLRALEKMIPVNPGAAVALAVECREASALALADLRDLVRGIYPPVLAERGLADALRALALDSPGKVDTDIDLPGRPPAPVEAAAYFAAAEALSNVAKHADARQTLVRAYHTDGMLRVEVTDDGRGGADASSGTGLAGIERRLAAFDGILALSSPAGGPTIVVIEVPCELSSLKISTC
jgi:signal transduction histidine kinase